MTIYNNPPLSNIPGYFSAQVHPENEVLPLLSASSQLFGHFQKLIWDQFSPPSPTPPIPIFKLHAASSGDVSEEEYHQALTQRTLNYLKISLREHIPPEGLGHFLAIDYAEKHLLSRKITSLKPDEFLEVVNRINLCFTQLAYKGSVYRDADAVVYTENMPKERTKETFLQVDHFMMKRATETEKKLWATTRAKVWKLAFAKQESYSPCSDEEKKLLKGLMAFTPSYKIVPEEMKKFAQEFCTKVNEAENLDLLCSWAHQELIRIHPYFDGNGRTARFVLNLVRMWAGENPLLFDNDQNYTKAARTLDSQAFSSYLQELKTVQFEIEPFMDQCLRWLHEETLIIHRGDQIMQQILKMPLLTP